MSGTAEPESAAILKFRSWFTSKGGIIHPKAQFKHVASGLSVCASDDVPADATIVSCPFSLAITPELAKHALSSLLKSPAAIEKWAAKQLIATYLCLHWIVGSDQQELPPVLAHLLYLDILPGPDKLRTPLHFTSSELDAFKGTNLYGAVDTRRQEWQEEWQACRSVVEEHDKSMSADFTWERYLTAATYVSSRAFPSTILSANPSLQSTDDSHPVLLPGIDSLNHARGAPVSWLISHGDASQTNLTVNLILHTATSAGDEMFNNYGPKPNSELILGYGFALPSNPSDTIVLQIGVGGSAPTQSTLAQGQRKKLEVGRAANGAEAVWDEVLALVKMNSDASEKTYEDHLEAAGMLGDMLLALQDRLPATGSIEGNQDVRSEVKEILEYYLEGQREILNSLLEFAQKKEQAAIEAARAQGIELVFDEDQIDEEDEEQYEDA